MRDMTLLCQEMPISMSAEGVVAVVPLSPTTDDRPQRSGECFSWEELISLRVQERMVRSDGRIVCQLSIPALARQVATRLRLIATSDPLTRASAIERFRKEAFDVVGISQMHWIR